MKYDPHDDDHFLNKLDLTEDEKAKLGALSPRGSFDLLARRKSAPQAFDEYIGIDTAEHICAVLSSLLTDEERRLLSAPPMPKRHLGARIVPPKKV